MPSLTHTLTSIALLARAVIAVSGFTNSDIVVEPGTPITLTWDASTEVGDVTILLMTGDSTDLQVIETIATSATNGSFTWTPPDNLESGEYTFQISDEGDDDPNYSTPFEYEADGGPSTTETSSTPEPTVTDEEELTTTSTNSTTTTTDEATTTETTEDAEETTEDAEETPDSTTTTTDTDSAEEPANTAPNLNEDPDDNGAAAIFGEGGRLALVVGVAAGVWAF